ncbi:M24 family metallopeptidase [Corynebacterium endometrii]|uniref:Xaa-Pro dipeptidase n=1 Tax=Corynebacterium endometrii TaxID=2488819 RepID=A0A4P7QHD6_9CORY|nr:Xaa-Pro peptidase family protein [Corynebacterium endometrii]QCB28426.1 Xaa-Pro dipeptidase [Corynebacterium endometrii]
MSESLTPFPPSVYQQRLDRAQKLASQAGIDALLIGTGADFAYLTGSWVSSHERLTVLVIPADGEVRVVAPGTDKTTLDNSPIPELAVTVVGWNDGEDAHGMAIEPLSNPSTIAVSGGLSADHLLAFQGMESMAETRWVLASEVLSELFTVKDEAEIEQLSSAGRAIDAVHARVPGLLRAGRTEAEVAEDIAELILEHHSAIDFIIVGSGPNGANPHHSYSDRVLSDGDPVVVDIGGTYGAGYHSDCTRTYVVGGDLSGAPRDFIEAYGHLEQAQSAAREQARPGVSAESVDAAARRHLEKAGYGDWFIHRTGHGIGLSTHEEPFIMLGNTLELAPGMAFSIEPGIYKPGEWGMRLEDIVVITDEGYESLNTSPRELR